jgi:CheY-like chemotaxis protein
MDEDRRLCLEAGMNEFVTKPIDVDQFYHVCNRLLSEKCKIC